MGDGGVCGVGKTLVAASSQILSVATYALPLLLLTLGAIGWFARRKITSAGRVEKLDLASKLLDVRSKLRSPELTQGQIDHILKAAGVDRSLLPDESQSIDNKISFDGDEPAILSTTAVMSARLISQLDVIDAKIEQHMVDIEILSGHNAMRNDFQHGAENSDHVRKMHKSWLRYRKCAALSAAEDYLGGTMSGAIYIVEEIRISEAFLLDLEDRLKSLKL